MVKRKAKLGGYELHFGEEESVKLRGCELHFGGKESVKFRGCELHVAEEENKVQRVRSSLCWRGQ